jgi:transcriptional regulator with XRE-family HTH domain
MEIGKKVKEIREAKGLSQLELARRIKTTQSAIARLEAGTFDPRLSTLQKIAKALKVDIKELL